MGNIRYLSLLLLLVAASCRDRNYPVFEETIRTKEAVKGNLLRDFSIDRRRAFGDSVMVYYTAHDDNQDKAATFIVHDSMVFIKTGDGYLLP